jgi:hypothetical protein
VLPVVNGQSLVEHVRAYQTEHGHDVPGGYDGLSINNFLFGAEAFAAALRALEADPTA